MVLQLGGVARKQLRDLLDAALRTRPVRCILGPQAPAPQKLHTRSSVNTSLATLRSRDSWGDLLDDDRVVRCRRRNWFASTTSLATPSARDHDFLAMPPLAVAAPCFTRSLQKRRSKAAIARGFALNKGAASTVTAARPRRFLWASWIHTIDPRSFLRVPRVEQQMALARSTYLFAARRHSRSS